jgi:hypothetical protein
MRLAIYTVISQRHDVAVCPSLSDRLRGVMKYFTSITIKYEEF